jgi:hypothetical protein
MDKSNHRERSCTKASTTCEIGQLQKEEPWADRERSCETCPAGSYQDVATISSQCKSHRQCNADEGLVLEAPGTITTDTTCRFEGNIPPTVSCRHLVRGAGIGQMDFAARLQLSVVDFESTPPADGVELERLWQRDDQLPSEAAQGDAQGADLLRGLADDLLAWQKTYAEELASGMNPSSAGRVVQVSFTASVVDNPALSSTCQTEIHLLAANTISITTPGEALEPPTPFPSIAIRPTAGVNATFASDTMTVRISGIVGDITFGLDGTLPPSVIAETTSTLSSSSAADDSDCDGGEAGGDGSRGSATCLSLRLLSTAGPLLPGRFYFNITARTPATSAETVVNGQPFVFDVHGCIDRPTFHTCVNGICAAGDDNPLDGEYSCECSADYTHDETTGHCTVLLSELSVVCPCDAQLAALPTQNTVPVPIWLNSSSVDVRGKRGNLMLSWTRDGQAVSAGDLRLVPLPAGGVTTFEVTVVDIIGGQSRSASCSFNIAVLRVDLVLERDEVHDQGAPVIGEVAQKQRMARPLEASILWSGLLFGMQLNFGLDRWSRPVSSYADLSAEGANPFSVNITQAYDVITLANSRQQTKRNTTLAVFVAEDDALLPPSGEYFFRVVAEAALVYGAVRPTTCRKMQRSANGSPMRRRRDGLPRDMLLSYGDDDSQQLQLAVGGATTMQVAVQDCLNSDGYDTCGNGGTCDQSGDNMNGEFTCTCTDKYQFMGGRCIAAEQATAAQDKASQHTAIGIGVAIIAALSLALAYLLHRRHQMRKFYHIFISYRVATDKELAEKLCEALQSSRRRLPWKRQEMVITCFWDKQDLVAGKNWRDGFLNGLHRSCLFLPIVSEAALAPIKTLTPTSNDDNVLLEYETALSLKERKRIAILPLLKGQTEQMEFNFGSYSGFNFPSTASPTHAKGTIAHTITDLLQCQGLKLSAYDWSDSDGAPPGDLIDEIVDTLAKVAWGADKGRRLMIRRRKSLSSALEPSAAEPDVDCLHLHRYWRGDAGIGNGGNLSDEGNNDRDVFDAEGGPHSTAYLPMSAWAQDANVNMFSHNPLFEPSNKMNQTTTQVDQHAIVAAEEETVLGFGAWEGGAEDLSAAVLQNSDATPVPENEGKVQLSTSTGGSEPTTRAGHSERETASLDLCGTADESSGRSDWTRSQAEISSSLGRYQGDMVKSHELSDEGMAHSHGHTSIAADVTTTESCSYVDISPTSAPPAHLGFRHPTLGPSSTWMAPTDRMERGQVEDILRHHEDGTFVVRDKGKGRYALSAIQGGKMLHDILLWDDKGWSLTGRRLVPAARGSLEELLDRLAGQDALQVLKTPLVRGAFVAHSEL